MANIRKPTQIKSNNHIPHHNKSFSTSQSSKEDLVVKFAKEYYDLHDVDDIIFDEQEDYLINRLTILEHKKRKPNLIRKKSSSEFFTTSFKLGYLCDQYKKSQPIKPTPFEKFSNNHDKGYNIKVIETDQARLVPKTINVEFLTNHNSNDLSTTFTNFTTPSNKLENYTFTIAEIQNMCYSLNAIPNEDKSTNDVIPPFSKINNQLTASILSTSKNKIENNDSQKSRGSSPYLQKKYPIGILKVGPQSRYSQDYPCLSKDKNKKLMIHNSKQTNIQA